MYACSTYSPGSLNLAVAVVCPLYGSLTLPPASVFISGRGLSNVTVPGPRYFDHDTLTGARLPVSGALVPLVYLASSSAQSGRSSGLATDVVRDSARCIDAIGPCIGGAFCSNMCRTGGLLPTASSSNGLTL